MLAIYELQTEENLQFRIMNFMATTRARNCPKIGELCTRRISFINCQLARSQRPTRTHIQTQPNLVVTSTHPKVVEDYVKCFVIHQNYVVIH